MRAPALSLLLALALLPAVPTAALADGGAPRVEGAALHMEIAPDRGFVDTPIALDGAGGRLAYVHTDAAALRELVVVDLASKAEIHRVALPAIAATPRAIAFAGEGDRFLIVAAAGEDRSLAVVLDARGKVVRKHGPAGLITPITYDERPAVSLYTMREIVKGKRAGRRHVVEVFDLETGKRLGKRRELATDFDDRVGKLEFTINHWLDGHTIAVGMLAGAYDEVQDVRFPEAEAWYDVPRGVFARRVAIADVVGYAKLRKVLAAHPDERAFLQPSQDRRRLERVAEGQTDAIELAEPFHHYDPGSLTYRAGPGGLFATLTIDPVHPDAAAKKRAVPVWVDLYDLAAGAAKATRRARLQPDGKPMRWLASSRYWVVAPRHVGFERGGPLLRVYALP